MTQTGTTCRAVEEREQCFVTYTGYAARQHNDKANERSEQSQKKCL
jgi:hypothetical protein